MTPRQPPGHPPVKGPVKILVVAHDSGVGGAQSSLSEIVERLDPARFEPIVLAPTPGEFLCRLRSRQVTCYWGLAQRWIFFDKPSLWRAARVRPWLLLMHPYVAAALSWTTMPLRVIAISMLAKAKGVRLIYSNTGTVMDGALAARLLGLPHVWHLRESLEASADLRFPLPVSWFPRFVLWTSAIAILNSHHLARDIFGASHREEVRIIHNGVDSKDHGRRSTEPPALPVPAGARITALCGRLTSNKGIDVYLRAMSRLSVSHPDLHHLVIGEGSAVYRSRMQELVRSLGLRGRVHFLGHRPDFRALLSSVDVLISASVRESFGRSVLEAMASGVPVVCTRSGGPEELVIDGQHGFLVDVGDEVRLAERVAALLDDKSLAAAMGVRASARVRERFSLDTTVAGVAACFEDALVAAPGNA